MLLPSPPSIEYILMNKSSAGLRAGATDPSLWQHYTSTRVAMRLFTPELARISFTDHTYATQDKAIIEYLDAQIAAAGNRCSFTKGELKDHGKLNPMQTLRAKHIKEFLAEQLANKVVPADMGLNESASQAKVSVTNTNQLATK